MDQRCLNRNGRFRPAASDETTRARANLFGIKSQDLRYLRPEAEGAGKHPGCGVLFRRAVKVALEQASRLFPQK
jgi:hypothetical protein